MLHRRLPSSRFSWLLRVLAWAGRANGADVRYTVTHLQATYGNQNLFFGLSAGGSYLSGSTVDDGGVYVDAFVVDAQGLRNLGIPENWGVTTEFSEAGVAYGIEVNQPGNVFTGVFSVDASGNISHVYSLQGVDINLRGVNNAGTLVGQEADATSSAGFLYTPGGASQNIDVLGGVDVFSFTAINNLGWIVGNGVGTTAQGTVGGAWLWVPGQEAVLIREGSPEAVAINDAGQIVGRSGATAYFWDDGVYQVVSNLLVPDPNNPAIIRNATTFAAATDINASGVVTGGLTASMVPGYAGPVGDRGWIWSEATGLEFLDDLVDPALGMEFSAAFSITTDGRILATTLDQGVVQHFLLTPIPEPGAGVLLLLASCRLLRRRRRV